jgi:DNA-binding transcriptional ArsR family regulator
MECLWPRGGLVKRRREAKHIYDALSDRHVLRLVQSAIEHAAEKK